jgi:hypothetical protein
VCQRAVYRDPLEVTHSLMDVTRVQGLGRTILGAHGSLLPDPILMAPGEFPCSISDRPRTGKRGVLIASGPGIRGVPARPSGPCPSARRLVEKNPERHFGFRAAGINPGTSPVPGRSAGGAATPCRRPDRPRPGTPALAWIPTEGIPANKTAG